jgi:hypothetical protein
MASIALGAERRDRAQNVPYSVLGEVYVDAGGGNDRRLAGIEVGGQPLPP